MESAMQNAARNPELARRRRILYGAAALGLLIVAVIAARPLFTSDAKPKKAAPVVTPVIVARVKMKPVDGSSSRGLAEVLRRGQAESVRVIATKLRPSAKNEAYQADLVGGTGEFKLLGTVIVGDEGIFVGESKTSIDELEQFKYIELRRVTAEPNATEKTILRGRIPR
ncbi:MAG: hypothetical protein QM648_01015 [Solirubrobacterales bacterium]